MIKTIKRTVYKAFGFTVSSEIPLQELPNIHVENDVVDIVIEKADLSTLWSENSESKEDFVIKKDLIMFHVSETALFLIKDGSRIFVSPFEGSQEDEIRLFILGTCMGAILLQRKILPLHGSAIAIEGKAYAIVGDSGAGKSTLASAFLNRGYQLLTDDVIAVSFSADNIPYSRRLIPNKNYGWKA